MLLTYSKKQIMFITIPASSDLKSSYYEIDCKNILGLSIKNYETYEFITTKKVYFWQKSGK